MSSQDLVWQLRQNGNLSSKNFKIFASNFQASRRKTNQNKSVPDATLIHDEIEQQTSHCQCRNAFKVHKMGEGKYRVSQADWFIQILA